MTMVILSLLAIASFVSSLLVTTEDSYAAKHLGVIYMITIILAGILVSISLQNDNSDLGAVNAFGTVRNTLISGIIFARWAGGGWNEFVREFRAARDFLHAFWIED